MDVAPTPPLAPVTQMQRLLVVESKRRLATRATARITLRERLRLFDAATARQSERERKRRLPRGKGRGWKREDLYTR